MFRGVLEKVTETEVAGWVFSPANPESALALEVLIEDEVVATGIANRKRIDLIKAGIGTGEHAFEIKLPTGRLRPGMAPRVRVRDTDTVLPSMSSLTTVAGTLETSKIPVQGVVEKVTPTEVAGWAFSPANPHSALALEVLIDKEVIATGVADRKRRDLVQAGVGTGQHAFEISLPPNRVKAGVSPYVRVRDTNLILPPISSLVVDSHSSEAAKPPIEGVLERVSVTEVSGWAFSPGNPESVVSLEVLIDDQIIATGIADRRRIDLVQAGIGTGHHAFEIKIAADRLKPNVVPKVRVRGTNLVLPHLADLIVSPTKAISADTSTREKTKPSIMVGNDQIRVVESSGLFDRKWYLQKYLQPDQTDIDPVAHYLLVGAGRLNDPSPNFSTDFYLRRYPDVARAGINPLLHYLSIGRREGRHPNAAWGSYALVVHAFHLDVLADLARYAANFPQDSDQYVTFPESYTVEQRLLIQRHFPKAELVPVNNIGQDVGALIQLMDRVNLKKYGFICKIHSKKGQKCAVEWRRTLLRGTLGSPLQVQNTIRAFQNNAFISLAGPKQLFIYGPNNLRRNGENIKTYFQEIVRDSDIEKLDWGFIGGTCFWARTSLLVFICEQLRKLSLTPAAYTDDGTPAHAAERMFGLLPTLRGEQILLNDAIKVDSAGTLINGFPGGLRRGLFTAASWLGSPEIKEATADKERPTPILGLPITTPVVAEHTVSGDLNLDAERPIISGWLAKKFEPRPREALIKCGDVELRVLANNFRSDLKQNGINDGCHAFYVSAPTHLMDGKKRDVLLIDAATGYEISRKTCLWQRPRRDYTDFENFLKASLTRPVVEVPFIEEDKRCFAVMENVANQLARRAMALTDPPLVSVIMPVYNRHSIVGQAMASVLAQDYTNFELIVIDDGSTDRSAEVINGYSDQRLKKIFLGTNIGHSSARNAGLRAAKGAIITYLDSDNTWDSRYLGATVGAYDSLPNAEAIYSGQLLYRGASTEPFAVRYGHLSHGLLQNQNYIDLNSFSHRSKVAGKKVRFDVSLRRFVDYDLIMRVAEYGCLFSVPMLLCNYFLDKATNTVTNNHEHSGDLKIVREKSVARTTARLSAIDLGNLERHVTVVIPSWEALDDIKDCLASLMIRDWNGMLDIVVVDNASSQGVVGFLEREAALSRLKLIANARNYGFTYAVNQGIAAARPDSDIVLLNNDAVVQQGAIVALQRRCYELRDAGMTVPRQILPGGTKTIQTHVPYANELNDCDVNISAHHRNVGNIPLFHNGMSLELTYAPFFAVYIRRDVIQAIGTLDAEYGRHYRSDRVYCDLMRSATGRRIYYVPDAFVLHKLQKSTQLLRELPSEGGEFELMFKRNQWDRPTAELLKFRNAPWDLF